MEILVAEVFSVWSTYRRNKYKGKGQLFFILEMITPIKHVADWRYIHQGKQAQIEKYVICKKYTWIKYDHIFRNQVFMINKAAYKYKMHL